MCLSHYYLFSIYERFTIFRFYDYKSLTKFFKNKGEQFSIVYSLATNEKIIKTHQSFQVPKTSS